MARAPLISYIPSVFSGTVKAFAPYPTPIGVHLSTSPVDKSSPVNDNDMMRENTSNPLKFLPSVNAPLWPLHEKPLSFNTSHWIIVVPPFEPLLDFHRGLGVGVLVLLSTECWVAHHHSGSTWRPMVWHNTSSCDTRRPFMCHLALLDEPVTGQVHGGRFDCEQSNAIIILFIQLGGRAILLCSRRIVAFLSSQW